MQLNSPVKFKSWIPSVTARLSFSTIGSTNHPSRCVRASCLDENVRCVAAYQARNTLDAPVPLLAEMFGLSGKFWFVCMAKSDSHGGVPNEKLEGRLFVFHSKQVWREKCESKIKKCQNFINNHQSTGEPDAWNKIKGAYDECLTAFQKDCAASCGFSLLRSGICEINCTPEDITSSSKPGFPEGKTTEEGVHMVASQLFFFLKDICHEHQHHSAKTDTLIDLHHVKNDHDTDWRKNVLYALYRKIIAYKRSRSADTIVDSKGTLAYARAFKKICEHDLGDEFKKLPYFSDETLAESLNAASEKLRWESDEKIHRANLLRNTIIGVLGSAFALASLVEITGQKILDPSLILIGLASFLVQHPVKTIIVIIVALFVFMRHERSALFRDFIRIFAYYSARKLGAFIFILGAISCALATWLFFQF